MKILTCKPVGIVYGKILKYEHLQVELKQLLMISGHIADLFG